MRKSHLDSMTGSVGTHRKNVQSTQPRVRSCCAMTWIVQFLQSRAKTLSSHCSPKHEPQIKGK